MSSDWSSFSYIVVNLARQIRPNELAFSGVNSTLPMLACLLAKRAYDFHFTYLNVAGGGHEVEPLHQRADGVLGAPGDDTLRRGHHHRRAPAARQAHSRVLPLADDGNVGAALSVHLGAAEKHEIQRTARAQVVEVLVGEDRRRARDERRVAARMRNRLRHGLDAAGNLQTVVTPIAFFQKRDGRLALESHDPRVTLAEVIRRTGFRFDASRAKLTAPVTPRERAALESLDPRGEFAAAVRA